MMRELGYLHQYFEKSNSMSGSAIFYKEGKFECLNANLEVFPGQSQFLMYCRFSLKNDPDF